MTFPTPDGLGLAALDRHLRAVGLEYVPGRVVCRVGQLPAVAPLVAAGLSMRET